MKRGYYNELIAIPKASLKVIKRIMDDCAKAEKVDDHGSWEFGAEFDRKGRGSSLNWDVYGYRRDRHNRKMIAVIQIRQFSRARKNYFPSIRKSYFLIGRNEDQSAFAHPIPSQTIHRAISKDASPGFVVEATQKWIFGVDYKKVIRQGDLALIPLKRAIGDNIEGNHTVLEDSHELYADQFKTNGSLYALNPKLVHIPGTHPTISATGWYKVVIGRRARFWDFAAPTID
jgi:hypothetical protein